MDGVSVLLLVTFRVYVLTLPSAPVTSTFISVFVPGVSAIASEAVPLATTVSFTLMVDLLSAAAAVTVMLPASFRDTSYSVVAALNAGWSVPALSVRLLRSAFTLFGV
ncbi:hypothetical protein D3C84_901910 [compost metagenome]